MVDINGTNYLMLNYMASQKIISLHDVRKESILTPNTEPIHLLLYRFGTKHETFLGILSL